MDNGHPITVFLMTALVLWAVYLWRRGRLGQPGLLPHPAALIGPPAPLIGPPVPAQPTAPANGATPGWQYGNPPEVTP